MLHFKVDLQLQNRSCFQWTGTSAKTPWYALLLQFQFFHLKTSEVQILLKLDVLLITGAENDILCEEHFLKKESFLHITLSSSREKWMMKVNSWTYGGPGFYRDSASKKGRQLIEEPYWSNTKVCCKRAKTTNKLQQTTFTLHLLLAKFFLICRLTDSWMFLQSAVSPAILTYRHIIC